VNCASVENGSSGTPIPATPLQGALEHRIAQMTPEQRRERLRELTERALIVEHDPHEFDSN
jgi:hypothetical protein